MNCREAFLAVANHEQDGDLVAFLMTDEGIAVESHVSSCRCHLCSRSQERIRTAGVRGRLRVVPGGRAASG